MAVADLRNFHVTQDRASLPIDDVSKRSLCTLLHHRCRYGQPIMPRVDEQPHIDQFARPKPVIRVGKFGLEADRPCRLQNLVIDELQRPLTQFEPVILTVSDNL